MRLLLDSHVFLWCMARDPRLSLEAMDRVERAGEVYVSAATAWELGLKCSIGKLRLPTSVEDGVAAAGFLELPVTFRHTRAAVGLPMLHRDPFDRLLIAQARVEGLVLVTHDDAILRYEVPSMRV